MDDIPLFIPLAGQLLDRRSQWQAGGQRAAGGEKPGVSVLYSFPALSLWNYLPLLLEDLALPGHQEYHFLPSLQV